MSVVILTKNTFTDEVMSSEKPVLIDFYATWCGPCRMVSPIIDEIAEERDDVKVCKVDVDREPELAQSFGIVNIPTVIAVKGGKVAGKIVGYRPKAAILDLLG